MKGYKSNRTKRIGEDTGVDKKCQYLSKIEEGGVVTAVLSRGSLNL